MIAGFALSAKLWLSTRLYPLTPVWSFLRPFGPPFDHIVFFVLAGLLVVLIAMPRREILIATFALLGLLALQDQSRWQPWFYQYVLMLLVIALAGPGRQRAALNTCCLIVAATYVWSGLAKLNPNFVDATFPALVEPFLRGRYPSDSWPVHYLARLAPFLECGAGIGLLLRRSRPVALVCAIAMHVLILISIGPLGRSFNGVVWPWNLAMIVFLLLLFKRKDDPGFQDILWGRGFAFQRIVLILFGVMPALSFFNLWDHYLSSALYSGNRNSGLVYLSDAAFNRLPPAIQDYVYEEGPNRSSLDINEWSLGEMNVPSYPEIRIYKNVARRICGFAGDGSGVELVVEGKLALIDGGRRSVYHCLELQGANGPASKVETAVDRD